MTPHIGSYRAVPIFSVSGDTLFVGAVLDKPTTDDPQIELTVVGIAPYEAYYGPLPAGIRLRVTNRKGGNPPKYIPLLDTIVRVP
jgi:hypothetical protein